MQRGQDSFVYDSHHRLIEATVDDTTATYAYNVHHQRTSKTVNGTTTHFFYGPGGELLSEMVVGTGLGPNEIVWLDGTPLAYLSGGEIYQIHVDHLGTPQVLTDDSGAIAWEAHYRPFGDAITTGSLTFNLRFPGQYHDGETGLHYNWHRYYDPATGRYLTSDPIGLEGGLNPYLYAEANPYRYGDINGLWALEIAYFNGVGGGISIGRDNGSWFASIRLGIGYGAGISFNPGKELPAPPPVAAAGNACMIEEKEGGSVGTFFAYGLEVPPYDLSLTGGGGYVFGLFGGPYKFSPSFGTSFTKTNSGPFRISAMAAAGAEINLWRK